MSADAIHPDYECAKQFLDLLEPDGAFWFQCKGEAPGSKVPAHKFSGRLTERWGRLVELNQQGAAIWVQINAGTGRKDANVEYVRSYFVDLDGADPSELLSEASLTDILVESSPGKYHGYWLAGDVPRELFKARQQALAAKFNGDRSVCNLARVMRLPGLYHHKGKPFCTRLIKPKGGA